MQLATIFRKPYATATISSPLLAFAESRRFRDPLELAVFPEEKPEYVVGGKWASAPISLVRYDPAIDGNSHKSEFNCPAPGAAFDVGGR